MWNRKNQHYLRTILDDLLVLGYQVRVCELVASHYGDPQGRARLFVFASRMGVPLRQVPSKTFGKRHGFVSVKDAIQHLLKPEAASLPNMEYRPATKSAERLLPDKPARTIRCSKRFLHYSENRCIKLRGALALQSFPDTYVVLGNSYADELRQVGNAVPVKMAEAAVARSVSQSLEFTYVDENGNVM